MPRPCIMTLLNCAVWPVPAQGGNAETVLRPEKVLSKCFRTGVRLPSAPPKGYYTNLFTLSAALPSQYGSGSTDRKERIFSLVESVRSFFMSCGLSTDCPWTVCGQSQNAAISNYRSVRNQRKKRNRYNIRKNPHKRDSECYNALAGVQRGGFHHGHDRTFQSIQRPEPGN